MNAFLTFVLISLCGITNALHLPVVARHKHNGAIRMQQVHVDQNVENARDVVYATNITLGGKEFPIQLDTGSSDVWVMPPFDIDLANTTDIQANLTFGIGQVTGNIAFANMSLGPHEVPSQAILNATNATDFGAIFSNNIFGILGLAFDLGSTVFIETVETFGRGNQQGLSFMSRVFSQNSSAPNMFTVLLGRSYDKDGPEEGAFTISEYVDGFEEVGNQTKLFRTPAQTVNITDTPRWSVLMDAMTVNGKMFKFNESVVPDAGQGQQVVVLDTGFTFSQLPPAAVDFIYSSIDGAQFNKTSGLWVVPCENTTELAFEFGGQSVAIHPLDITTVTSNGNQTICTNAYRAINLPPGATSSFDFILGDSFLKNVYASFDFGDFTPDNRTAGVPFVQMLGTTKLHDAQAEFKSVRCKQVKKNDAKLANTTTTDTGSLQLDNGLSFVPLTGLGKRAAEEHAHRVVVTMSARPIAYMRPMRIHHHVANCMNQMTDAFGPVAVALLAGTFGIMLMMLIVGITLGIRKLVRWRREDEGYEVLESEKNSEAVLFDADQHYYNHHATTTETTTMRVPTSPPAYPIN
ncbi:hypothetical protein PHLGIDRAFT_125889 [Phlebiopsis gigantea 11061_1 CR5-6]|uniref:Peptidase A1 domain-containing protein n=1 Tax=Phlebiopsis gigantea (strain 11061_1 CR5-6) TaxID=745531 RepID=A0A0C3S3F0_PHLG1|nr:hypothetical protein PHLGIDRAFT_125889 [Phlebiopsis gigantea 11061_1 CR5-6]